jgi:hypothetical protein
MGIDFGNTQAESLPLRVDRNDNDAARQLISHTITDG